MYDTPSSRTRQGPSLVETVLAYHRRGWSIIPIKPGTKEPACRSWKPYQSRRPTESQLRKWFNERDLGMAVILGEVSGGLVCRDFDTMEGYERWKGLHPDLASTLPTVATARGRHVYFVGAERKITKLPDGELRGAGYCLLPPSQHPDGPIYRWLVPLPDGPLPYLEDTSSAGLSSACPCNRENGDNRREQRITEAIEVGVGLSGSLDDGEVSRVIIETLPTCPGRRNAQVFQLARGLRSIPWLADAEADDLEPCVRHWHDLGIQKGLIGTPPFEETWIDFLYAWPKVKFPKGAEPMTAILERTKQLPMPRAARRYEQPGLRLLVALCQELQRESGERPFFLACRTAGKLLGVDHTTAWRWLFLLQHDKVIKEVEKGRQAKRRASRYRYLGD